MDAMRAMDSIRCAGERDARPNERSRVREESIGRSVVVPSVGDVDIDIDIDSNRGD